MRLVPSATLIQPDYQLGSSPPVTGFLSDLCPSSSDPNAPRTARKSSRDKTRTAVKKNSKNSTERTAKSPRHKKDRVIRHHATLAANFKPSSGETAAPPPSSSLPALVPTTATHDGERTSPTRTVEHHSAAAPTPEVLPPRTFMARKSAWRRTIGTFASLGSALEEEGARVQLEAEWANESKLLSPRGTGGKPEKLRKKSGSSESGVLELPVVRGLFTAGEDIDNDRLRLTWRSSSPRLLRLSTDLWVELATHHSAPDQCLRDALIICCPLFTTTVELLKLVANRVATNIEQQFYRSLVFIERWIELCPSDFSDNEAGFSALEELILSIPLETSDLPSRGLLGNLASRLINLRECNLPFNPRDHAPSSSMPMEMPLFAWSDKAIAEQLCLLATKRLLRIPLHEFTTGSWTAVDSTECQRINEMISQWNHLSNWVSSVILLTLELEDRARILERMIKIAERCRELNNFHSLMAILGSLLSTPISRLSKTWALLSSKVKKAFHELHREMTMERNYWRYRRVINKLLARNNTQPFVPYIGVTLSDLTFSMTGNPTYKGDLLNFEKFEMIYRIISTQVVAAQARSYTFEPDLLLQSRLQAMPTHTDSELYNESLMREPRSALTMSTVVAAASSSCDSRQIHKSASEMNILPPGLQASPSGLLDLRRSSTMHSLQSMPG